MSAPRLGSGVWTFLGGDTLRRQVGADYDEYRVAAGRVTRHVHDSGKVRYPDGSIYTGATYLDQYAALESEGRWLRYSRDTFADRMRNPTSPEDLARGVEKFFANKKRASD